jgi:hypothetical protein
MRFLSKAAFAALLALGLATAGRAAPVNPLLPTQGTREISLRGNFIIEPDDSYDLTASYGPFLDTRLQVGAELGFAKAGDFDVYTLGAFANYHFPGESAVLPFVGIFLGYTDGDQADGDISYGLQGGVKYFLNNNVSFNASLVYRNLEDADDTWGLFFGLSTYLR